MVMQQLWQQDRSNILVPFDIHLEGIGHNSGDVKENVLQSL